MNKKEQESRKYCNKVLFPFLIRLRIHVNKIKERLAAGEKLDDIHADMAARGDVLR